MHQRIQEVNRKGERTGKANKPPGKGSKKARERKG
jgi:hypothetical protein